MQIWIVAGRHHPYGGRRFSSSSFAPPRSQRRLLRRARLGRRAPAPPSPPRTEKRPAPRRFGDWGGYEHEFQYSEKGGIHYVLSGAGGKLRDGEPQRFEEAHTRAWAVEGHFLVVELDEERTLVHPLTDGEGGGLRAIRLETPEGEDFPTPIEVPLEG